MRLATSLPFPETAVVAALAASVEVEALEGVLGFETETTVVAGGPTTKSMRGFGNLEGCCCCCCC